MAVILYHHHGSKLLRTATALRGAYP